MTDANQQPYEQLKQLYSDTPNVNPQAKANARSAALEAFQLAQSSRENTKIDQENIDSTRPIRTRFLLGVKAMFSSDLLLNKKWLTRGALASVVLVGLTAAMVQFLGVFNLSMEDPVEYYALEMQEDAAIADITTVDSNQVAGPNTTTSKTARAELPAQQLAVQSPSLSLNADISQAPKRPPAPESSFADSEFAVPPQANDEFDSQPVNRVKRVVDEPISTFSIDVDTSSYSFVRRLLKQGQLPAKNHVRLEEMVNYFDYEYPVPETSEIPFTTSVTVLDSPWKAGNKLVHIGLQGYELPKDKLPKSNLVFLLDVSGSMNQVDKLPLVKQSMQLLLSQLQPTDTVAIVVYAGAAGVVLEPTPVAEKTKIMTAMEQLNAGGSTAGGAGIELAYRLAEDAFDAQAVNRVILATDGDFNVGTTDHAALTELITQKRDKGIFLSVLGFGQGNYHDNLMQSLAQNGNGVAAYIDTLAEAQKVLVHQATSTLFTIAKDVKIQVEFNPATVAEYRLLGFESRLLNREDFNNDKIDAGDIGAGHSMTAIYEITPAGGSVLIAPQRYGQNQPKTTHSEEYGFVKLRYKLPDQSESQLIEQPILVDSVDANGLPQQELEFSVAVAGFAQILAGSPYLESFALSDVLELAQRSRGDDEFGYRAEFVQLVRTAQLLRSADN